MAAVFTLIFHILSQHGHHNDGIFQAEKTRLQGYGQNPKTTYSLSHDHEGDQKETIAASAWHKN